jgi:hypothetical protein
MDIESRKIQFVQEFLKLQGEMAIARLEKLLKLERIQEEELKPMSDVEFNKRIDASIKDYENGNVITSMELQEEMAKWGTK